MPEVRSTMWCDMGHCELYDPFDDDVVICTIQSLRETIQSPGGRVPEGGWIIVFRGWTLGLPSLVSAVAGVAKVPKKSYSKTTFWDIFWDHIFFEYVKKIYFLRLFGAYFSVEKWVPQQVPSKLYFLCFF